MGQDCRPNALAPIIARKADGEIIAGHTRLKAAQSLGIETVPVRYMDLDPADAHLLAIADNKLNEKAIWDNDGVAKILSEFSLDDAALAGFDSKELEKLGADILGDNKEPPTDEAPEPPDDPVTKPGDVWILGDHRLMCGDSTSQSAVYVLMDGGKADMVFTDPPYNIAFGGTMSDTTKGGVTVPHRPANSHHAAIENDKQAPADFEALILSLAAMISEYCKGAYYISFCSGNLHELLGPIVKSGLGYKSVLAWVKNQSPMGGGAYRRRYEPIVYGNNSPELFYGKPYAEDDVWEFDRTNKNDLHPTMKPVPLVAKAVEHGSQNGDIVLDLFGGSGSTLMACEQTGRQCRMMELSPAYCDVIVKRWEDYTGKTAVRAA